MKAVFVGVHGGAWKGPLEWEISDANATVHPGLPAELKAVLKDGPTRYLEALNRSAQALIWLRIEAYRGYSFETATWLNEGDEVHIVDNHEVLREQFENEMSRQYGHRAKTSR